MNTTTFSKADSLLWNTVGTYMVGERSLSDEEIRRAKELQERNIPSENKAYEFFPKSIKAKVVRNIPVAFVNHNAFYPDFLLCEEKILIEIDDWKHNYSPRKEMDKHRDKVFREHGYQTLRFKDKELKDKTKFLNNLYIQLNKVLLAKGRRNIKALIEELSHETNIGIINN